MQKIIQWLDEQGIITFLVQLILFGGLLWACWQFKAAMELFQYFGIPVVIAWAIAKQDKWYKLNWSKFLFVLIAFRILFMISPPCSPNDPRC